MSKTILTGVNLSRNTWETDSKLKGKISFQIQGQSATTTELELDDEACNDIVKILSAKLVEHSQRLAIKMCEAIGEEFNHAVALSSIPVEAIENHEETIEEAVEKLDEEAAERNAEETALDDCSINAKMEKPDE